MKTQKIQLKNHQDWFTCYELPDNIYAIREEQHWQNVSSFLIVGKERAVLFDTGLGIKNIKIVAEELFAGEILVINSHCHFDHIGGNWQFKEVFIPENSYALKTAKCGASAALISDQAVPEAFAKGYPPGFTPEKFCCRPYKGVPMKEGTVFELGDRTLEYIYTPGHSQDCIMLYDRPAGILLCGDMIYLGTLFAQFDDDFYGTSDLDQYISSLEKIRIQCPELKALYVSHEECILEPAMLSEIADTLKIISDRQIEGKISDVSGYGYGSGETVEFVFDRWSIILKRENL